MPKQQMIWIAFALDFWTTPLNFKQHCCTHSALLYTMVRSERLVRHAIPKQIACECPIAFLQFKRVPVPRLAICEWLEFRFSLPQPFLTNPYLVLIFSVPLPCYIQHVSHQSCSSTAFRKPTAFLDSPWSPTLDHLQSVGSKAQVKWLNRPKKLVVGTTGILLLLCYCRTLESSLDSRI